MVFRDPDTAQIQHARPAQPCQAPNSGACVAAVHVHGDGTALAGTDHAIGLLPVEFGLGDGTVVGETWSGRSLGTSWRIAKAAFRGRITGVVGKRLIGAVMIAVAAVAMMR